MKEEGIVLSPDYFKRDTVQVAQELLGKVLIHKTDDEIYRGIITETEAYHGEQDLACHCSKGLTKRTAVMYGKPGRIYVYLIYGMYEMLNFVTMEEGFPAAVLIRGLKEVEVSRNMQDFEPIIEPADGPGKLTKRMKITRDYNEKELSEKTGLYVMDYGIHVPNQKVISTPRIGINYAKEWKDKPWRFYIKNRKD